MTEIYYNSGQFAHTIRAAEKEFTEPFSFYEALGDFYERKGYDTLSHSRIRRYEILLEFLEEKKVVSLDFYRQLMVYDLYARENMKTRPSWALERAPWKENIRAFYEREKECPRYLSGYREYSSRQMEKMTHLEVFTWNVMEEKQEKGIYPVVFDYQKRSPLTNDALAVPVEF